MKQAKELARVYRAFDGQVTFYMLPWNTILVNVNINKLSKLTGKPFEQFDTAEKFLPSADALTVDIEFTEPLTPEVEGLRAYWQSRNGDFEGKYDCFMSLLSDDVFIQWLAAYGDTRDRSLSAEDGIETPPDGDDPKKKSRMTKLSRKEKRTGNE